MPSEPTAPQQRMRSAERRRQILDAAIEIVGRRGYYGFSVQEVAARCGLTVAGVLHHVGTKDQLLLALLDERDRRDAEAVPGLLASEEGERPGLARLRALVARNSTQPELVRLYSMLRTESLYEEHPAHGYFLARERRVLALFARCVAGEVGEEEAGPVARQLLALMGGLEEQWLRSGRSFDLVEQWDLAVARLLPAAGR
ncbi:TetR/AcrR family transcriptional regulator [Nonomuraea sp. NPDC050783]|uniref:TetR/AcrR family transcriptional regulator n=1 Tax=Nonomuraea sp. NPDC050783 TaxID=3154634 RepID=UPI003466113B